jgi:hypothetical protein
MRVRAWPAKRPSPDTTAFFAREPGMRLFQSSSCG